MEKTQRGTLTSGSTVNRELQYLRAAFNHAKVKPNPFENFKSERETERVRFLKQSEMIALLDAAATSQNEHLKIIIETAILTGLRKMEILKLHRDNVDFSLDTIFVPATQEKAHKNKTVPLPSSLKGAFQRLSGVSKSGYLFENQSTGTHFGDIKNAWRCALNTAKIKDFRFHDLRHTFASYSLLTTNDLRTVQEIFGHSRISTTQEYAHIILRQKFKVVENTGKHIRKIIKM